MANVPDTLGTFRAGSEFTLKVLHPPQSGETWTFNPQNMLVALGATVPVVFALDQNYPNPFNPATKIRYHLPSASQVALLIYDLLGREVARLIEEVEAAGMHEVEWNAQKEASGVYFYRLKAVAQDGRGGVQVETRKMICIR